MSDSRASTPNPAARLDGRGRRPRGVLRRALAPTLALVLVALWAAGARPALAQDYRFNVSALDMNVHVLANGQARIVYDITFDNAPGADPIDIVDIGTPHDDYDIDRMSASIGDAPLGDIRPSEYVDPGVEVHLDDQAIRPGTEGTLRLEMTVPGLLFGDTTRSDYASMQITPTWFDPNLVTGRGKVRIAVHLPPGIPAEALLYQDVPFAARFDQNGQAIAYWEFEDVPITGPLRVGLSFPKAGIAGVEEMSSWDLAVKWLEDNPVIRIGLAALFMLGLGFLFFRFSHGTGWSLFLVLAVVSGVLFFSTAGLQIIALLVLPFAIYLNERALRRRKHQPPRKYLPAIAELEGGGIKRGLTAPEAAVLLELPLHRVLSLVVFGLLKKGVAVVQDPDPFTVALAEPFQVPPSQRLQAAQDAGTVLHPYEQPFLDEIAEHGGRPVAELKFGAALDGLIEHVAGRLSGFDLSDTQDYYRQIVKRAVTEAGSTVDIPEREKVLDRDFEWILIDDRYPEVLGGPGRGYHPRWWGHGPVGGGSVSVPVPDSGGRSSPGGSTSFGDVAASFAGWTESTMGKMADSVAFGGMKSIGGGILDLSGVDRVTMDVLESMAESAAKGGSGGGGGGGGCACAGCACACACAGGGR